MAREVEVVGQRGRAVQVRWWRARSESGEGIHRSGGRRGVSDIGRSGVGLRSAVHDGPSHHT